MAVPFCIGKIIDLIYTSEKELMIENLNKFCGALMVVFLIGGLANFGRVYSLHLASQRMVKRLREQLFSRIMRQEVAFFDRTKTGELVNRLSTDTTVVAQSLSHNISDGLRSIFQALGGIGMMVSCFFFVFFNYHSLTFVSMLVVILPNSVLQLIVYVLKEMSMIVRFVGGRFTWQV